MPCYRPLKGYRSRIVNPSSGKRSIVFNVREGFVDMPADVPCGQCIGCRLERSRQWAIRCVHEASLYEANSFITLTYSDDHLPSSGSLDLKHFQDFMKRLRFRFGSGIRFYHCGEYGERFSRPHYHACLFNFDFSDKLLFRTVRGLRLYTSESLQELWPFGFSTVGSVTFESAAYVARYITKKVLGSDSSSHYGNRIPEYQTMSRRPGIGKLWLDSFFSDVYPSDSVVIRGREMRPPKYYDRQLEVSNPDLFARVKACRRRFGELALLERSESRLSVIERVHLAKNQRLQRSYETYGT
jgi:hypothetical protein